MWGKRQGEGRAIPEGRDFPRATNGWKGRAKALPAEGTGSATVTGLPGIAWTQAIHWAQKQCKACGLAKVCSQDSGQHPSACQGHQGSQHGALSHTGSLVLCASPAASMSRVRVGQPHIQYNFPKAQISKEWMGCLYAASSSDCEVNTKN